MASEANDQGGPEVTPEARCFAILSRYIDAWHNEYELGEAEFDEISNVRDLCRFLAARLTGTDTSPLG